MRVKQKTSSTIQICIMMLVSILATASCNKNEISIPITKEQLPKDINIEAIHFHAPYLYVAGGTYKYGAVFRRHTDSVKWNLILETSRKINDISDFGNSLLFVGDSVFASLYTIETNTFGEPYYYPYFEPYPKTVSNFKKIRQFGSYTITISELYQIAGNIYFSPDTCKIQYMKMQAQNGLFDIAMLDNDSAIICGYGQVFAVSLKDWKQNRRSITDEIFTGIQYQKGTLLLCSFDGNIYKSNNNGVNWSKKFSSPKKIGKRIRLNKLCFANGKKVYSIGENGSILVSEDDGDNWNTVKNSCNEKLLSIATVQNRLYIGGSGGTLLTLDNQ